MTTLDHKPVNPEVDTIRHHYEVSNDFYRLLLGPAMMYSGRRSAADGQPGVQLGGLPRPDRAADAAPDHGLQPGTVRAGDQPAAVRRDPRQVRADCFRSSRGMDRRDGLHSVDVPSVVLAGSADTVIDPKLGQVVAETLPNARYEELADKGHMLPLEAPDRVAKTIADLVTGVAG